MFRKKSKNLMVKDLIKDLQKGDRTKEVMDAHMNKKEAPRRRNTLFFNDRDEGGMFNTGFGATATMSW